MNTDLLLHNTEIDALLWDMDGVLVDVSSSYREAIRKTTQQFCPNQKVTREDVDEIKALSGLNNDWDATYALVSKLTNPDAFDPERLVSNLGNIRNSERYQKMKLIFQSFYLGEEFFTQVYTENPVISYKNGLISNEQLLISREQLMSLKDRYRTMAIVTGRPRVETEYTLKLNRIDDLFDAVVTMEDTRRGKPFPDPIEKAVNMLQVSNPVYIGDTINDVQAAKQAGILAIYVGEKNLVDYQASGSDSLIETLLQQGTKNASPQKDTKPSTVRTSETERSTYETQIKLSLTIDGIGEKNIQTPIGFFTHMMELFTAHGSFDIDLDVNGDTHIDDHHTIEDVGIVLGQAFAKAIDDKKGINRYGFFVLPMDECLTTVAFDFSGRYAFQQYAEFKREKVGDMSTELVHDFWDSFAQNAKANLIIKSEFGRNDHHKVEGIFKAAARAIRIACSYDPHAYGRVPSTKGVL